MGVYLIVAPLTVLYALGYLFSPAEQKLLQTGLVSLDSRPSRADVSLNGSPLKERTPLVLRNLEPGTYDIQVSLPDRHLWKKMIEVKPERALRLENILLFPLSFEKEIFQDKPISKIWYAPPGKYLVILRGSQASELSLFDLEEKTFRRILPRRYQGTKIKEVHLHPGGDQAIITLEKNGFVQAIFAKFTDPIQVTSLSDFLKEPFA